MDFELYTYILATTEVLTMLIIGFIFTLHYRKLAKARIAMLKDAKQIVGLIKESNRVEYHLYQPFRDIISSDIGSFYKKHFSRVAQAELEFQVQSLYLMLQQSDKLMEMKAILKR